MLARAHCVVVYIITMPLIYLIQETMIATIDQSDYNSTVTVSEQDFLGSFLALQPQPYLLTLTPSDEPDRHAP